jgi:hypothetical protein
VADALFRDRSQPLEKRSDLTGRLVRLLGSVYLTRVKDSVGELLFSLLDQDRAYINPFFVPVWWCILLKKSGEQLKTAKTFALTLGYGNASGFLASANMLIPPPESTDGSINPITGASYPSQSTGSSSQQQQHGGARGTPADDEMTEEEKEQEAERLFMLFERLQKTGVVSVKNPITEAKQSGRFEEIEDDEDSRRKEEEEEERKAMEEMRKYKERKAGSSRGV